MTNLEDPLGGVDLLAGVSDSAGIPVRSALDEKINAQFPGAVVRKDLATASSTKSPLP
jgi:ATP-dependent Lon protease